MKTIIKKKESYDGDPTVAEVKQYLQRTLDELDSYADNATVIMSPNTYGISNYFIALGSHGYMPMEGFDVDREDEEDESRKCKAREALSSKLQDRSKFRELAVFLKGLPFFGQTIGETVDTLRKEGLGYGVGDYTKEDQEAAAKDILGDFDEYTDWEIKEDPDGWYIQVTFKPELWALPIEELKEVFSLLDDAFGPYA